VAVEAALVLPVLVIVLLGVWEVGRLVQVNQLLENAAREGARLAAGGYVNGVGVTSAMVQQAVRDYLTAAGLPAGTVNGAQIQVTNLSANKWSDPVDAQPRDQFRVTVTIPQGTAFDSMKWALVKSLTNVNSMSVSVVWNSANDSQITIDTGLPY
jgi:Flp pilus assembly protein TadG